MKKNRILIVDDQEANRYYLRSLLQGQGYDVAEASQGAEALEQARRAPPDLIVSDILMPVMDGFALCREWKKDKTLQSIPFVFYTATYTDGRDREFARSIGADEFILKPQEPDALLAQLRGVLEAGAPRVATATAGAQEEVFLRQYNQTLIRKLEAKMEQLERDIAARKAAEERLQDSQTRFRELFGNMTSGVAVYEARDAGADFVFKDINRAGQSIGELNKADVVGRPVTEVFPGIRDMGLLEVLRRVWQTGVAECFPSALYADGRQSNWYENRVYKLPSGEVVAVYDNVTDRKKAEEALRESEERFRSFVENANDIVYSLCLEGTLLYVSPNWTEILGHDVRDVVGRPFTDFIHPDDLSICLAALQGARAGRKQNGVEYRIRHLDGSWRWHMTNGSLIVGDDGQPKYFQGIARDVTALKRAEEESGRLQAQLSQAQKMESVGRLAGGVAHDFNNMLGVILGHAELALEKSEPGGPLEADLVEIQKAAERSADLTRQLLAFARQQTVLPQVLDLNETVEGMLKMLRRLIGEDIELAWQPGQNLGPVKIDPSQIDQILANLCVNARDAISGAGRIAIETGKAVFDSAFCGSHPGAVPGEYVRLAVRDNGGGMGPETLGKLFEPFFTTKGIGQGTGLGLSTVYGAVKQNEGFIDVESEPGKGTNFLIYLPRYAGKADPERKELPAAPVVRGHETILLVEDEPAILSIGTTLLERLGYQVLGAATPGEALRLAERYSGEIHLLMTDVVMPEMNGRDLAKGMLALYPHLKRIFMSGYTSDVIAHHGVLAEGVNFIQKPFSIKTLSAKLREALDG